MNKEHSELCASLPAFLHARVKPEQKAINEEKREVLHRISSINPDRVGDVVMPRGVDLQQFERHPVVLLDHDYRAEKIVGKAVHLEVKKDEILARTRYLDTPLGRDAFNLVREGLGAFSIGFKPTEIEPIEDEKTKGITGFLIKEWELLEYSQVAIPMNPDAVTLAVQKGLVHQENITRFFISQPAAKEEVVETEAPVEEPAEKTLPPEAAPVFSKLADRIRTETDIREAARTAARLNEITVRINK